MKEVSKKLSEKPLTAERINPIAYELGLVKPEPSNFTLLHPFNCKLTLCLMKRKDTKIY